jgi:hypothetical protein
LVLLVFKQNCQKNLIFVYPGETNHSSPPNAEIKEGRAIPPLPNKIMIIYVTSLTVTQEQLDKSVENSQTLLVNNS